MGKLRRLIRCFNCGDVLQSNDPEAQGYVPEDVLHAQSEKLIYCQNCYEKMRMINAGLLQEEADDDILTILEEAVAGDSYIFWVVDLTNSSGLLDHEVVEKVKGLDIIVIGTKFDMLPRLTKIESVQEYLKERFNEVGINPKRISIIGNDEELDQKKVLEYLNAYKDRDVYMIGQLGCGKTSLIDRVMKYYTNNTRRIVKTETYPNTNAQVLEIPLSKTTTLYEVPGFSLANSILGKVEKELTKFIVPQGRLDMKWIRLGEGHAFIIGSLAAFVLQSGKATSFRFYSSDKVEVKHVLSGNVKNEFSTNFIKRHVRPVSERISTFTDYDVFEYEMEDDGLLHEIAISGLGFVTFLAEGQTIRVFVPKGTAIKECQSRLRKRKKDA